MNLGSCTLCNANPLSSSLSLIWVWKQNRRLSFLCILLTRHPSSLAPQWLEGQAPWRRLLHKLRSVRTMLPPKKIKLFFISPQHCRVPRRAHWCKQQTRGWRHHTILEWSSYRCWLCQIWPIFASCAYCFSSVDLHFWPRTRPFAASLHAWNTTFFTHAKDSAESSQRDICPWSIADAIFVASQQSIRTFRGSRISRQMGLCPWRWQWQWVCGRIAQGSVFILY